MTITQEMAGELLEMLRQHHNWHLQDGLEMKLGDDYWDCASCYVDSTMEERTTAVLSKVGHQLSAEKEKGKCEHRWATTSSGTVDQCIRCGARRPTTPLDWEGAKNVTPQAEPELMSLEDVQRIENFHLHHVFRTIDGDDLKLSDLLKGYRSLTAQVQRLTTEIGMQQAQRADAERVAAGYKRKSTDQDAEITRLRVALEPLVSAAKLLAANSEECLKQHHGFDPKRYAVPGWLTDAQRDIDRASAALQEGKADG